MNPQKLKTQKRQRRKARVRAKIFGTSKIPRLSVFRSLNHIYCQLIDDEKGRTLVSASEHESTENTSQLRSGQAESTKSIKTPLNSAQGRQEHKNITTSKQSDQELVISDSVKEYNNKIKKMTTKVSQAFALGELLAKKALEKNIKKCVFDKSYYKYHGKVKAVADGAREGGLNF